MTSDGGGPDGGDTADAADPDSSDDADWIDAPDTADAPDSIDTADVDAADAHDTTDAPDAADVVETGDSGGADAADTGDAADIPVEVIELPEAAPYCDVNACAFDTEFDDLEALENDALRTALNERVSIASSYGYDTARNLMYAPSGGVDVNDGMVECVYTGVRAAADGTRTPEGIFNTEHVWPRDRGADVTPALSDMHHIRPTLEAANTARANFHFGETPCNGGPTCTWSLDGSELGTSPYGVGRVFEVRAERRGDIARSMFYFAVRYGLPIDEVEEATLRVWNVEDPPDEFERTRHERVVALQHNRNPFIDRPDFVERIADY